MRAGSVFYSRGGDPNLRSVSTCTGTYILPPISGRSRPHALPRMAQTVLLKTCTCSDYCHSTPQVFFLQVYSHTFSRIEKSAMASPRVILVMIEMCECDESPAVWLESRLWCWRCSEVESSGSFGNNFVATGLFRT